MRGGSGRRFLCPKILFIEIVLKNKGLCFTFFAHYCKMLMQKVVRYAACARRLIGKTVRNRTARATVRRLFEGRRSLLSRSSFTVQRAENSFSDGFRYTGRTDFGKNVTRFLPPISQETCRTYCFNVSRREEDC